MTFEIIATDKAPKAIGTYSQAVKTGNTVYLSGQIPLVPDTMELVSDDTREQIDQAFKNLQSVVIEAGGTLSNVAKLNIYLIDLTHFPIVNEIMANYFKEPYPARAAIGVAELPKGSQIEMDGIMVLDN